MKIQFDTCTANLTEEQKAKLVGMWLWLNIITVRADAIAICDIADDAPPDVANLINVEIKILLENALLVSETRKITLVELDEKTITFADLVKLVFLLAEDAGYVVDGKIA